MKGTSAQFERIVKRDTIYSSALVDISEGATVSLPDARSRYLSLAVINEDNYTTAVHHGAGTIELTVAEHETSFVALVVRTLVDWTDDPDLAVAGEAGSPSTKSSTRQAPPSCRSRIRN